MIKKRAWVVIALALMPAAARADDVSDADVFIAAAARLSVATSKCGLDDPGNAATKRIIRRAAAIGGISIDEAIERWNRMIPLAVQRWRQDAGAFCKAARDIGGVVMRDPE